MKYLDEFLSVFGDFTVSQITAFILACIFLYSIYNVVKKYFISKHEAQQRKDEELKEALEAARKYPEYRKQSIKVQEALETKIQELREMLQSDH
jgi:predicted Holliday junction resolvase-like endonuclease